jgi:hypothetical protein
MPVFLQRGIPASAGDNYREKARFSVPQSKLPGCENLNDILFFVFQR